MPDLNRPSLDVAFQELENKLVQVLEYATAVAPLASEKAEVLSSLAESLVVLVVVRIDEFFKSLVSLGARHKEQVVRAHFRKQDVPHAGTCDLPTLMKLVRGRAPSRRARSGSIIYFG